MRILKSNSGGSNINYKLTLGKFSKFLSLLVHINQTTVVKLELISVKGFSTILPSTEFLECEDIQEKIIISL